MTMHDHETTGSSQAHIDTQDAHAAAGPTPPTTSGEATSRAPASSGALLPHGAKEVATPNAVPHRAGEEDATLLLLADTLDDIEKMRIALQNRLRSLTGEGESESGHQWGLGVSENHPAIVALTAHLDAIGGLEHAATLELQRFMRVHRYAGWVAGIKGVGEKQGARLIASLGPVENRATVSQLWAYCGLHVVPAHKSTDTHGLRGGDDPQTSHTGQGEPDIHRRVAGVAPSHRQGKRGNWNPTAKMRVWNVAQAVVKAGVRRLPDAPDAYEPGTRTAATEWGQVWIDARDKYDDAVHTVTCVRCGPSGKPTPAGSPLSAAHKKARADRILMKELLKDLWRYATGTPARSFTTPTPLSPASHVHTEAAA